MLELSEVYRTLRTTAGTYPEAHEEAPWGELVIKVRKKIFLFLGGGENEKLSLSLKLPISKSDALALPECVPTGYGLGRHGWCSFSYVAGDEPPVESLLEWLDESYRAVAPKRLVRAIEEPVVLEPVEIRGDLAGQRVLVIGRDPLRRKRAIDGLTSRGLDAHGVDLESALDAAGAGDPHAIVLDLSRDAQVAMGLLGDLGLVGADALILVAGVRNAKMERTLQQVSGLAGMSREAPGEPQFLEQLFAVMGG